MGKGEEMYVALTAGTRNKDAQMTRQGRMLETDFEIKEKGHPQAFCISPRVNDRSLAL